MTAVSKNAHGDKLPELFDNYNNTNHSLIKIKCAYANPDSYIYFDVENNKKTKINIDDHKSDPPNWSEKDLVIQS